MNPSFQSYPFVYPNPKRMYPRRAVIPFLFLFSFAAILLYSYHYQSSVQLSHPETPNRLAGHLRRPNLSPQGFTLTVKVLTFNRIDSLRRCLRSLDAADYGSDLVDLHVLVDHFHATAPDNSSTSLFDRKLEESRRILDLVDSLEWRHGQKLVHYRTGNAGLQSQWLEAWWPVSDNDFAFIVEDDLEVSPLYYKYLKALIMRYYYDRSNYSPLIYGASLQRPRFVAGKHGNKVQVDNDTHLFLYQMVGTWGQLLFPRPWKEFRLWYDAHKAKGLKPILQGMVTTGWYRKIGERIWTPWFIKFIHVKGYFNIYTNFLDERALSISYRDAGVNYGKTAGPDSKLLVEKPQDFNIWDMQPLKILKWYDFCFREVVPGRIVKSYDELGLVLNILQKQNTIIIVSLYTTTEKLAKNLLCHLERLNIQNVIFIGGRFIDYFAQRGYAAIDSDKLIKSIEAYKFINSELSRTDIMKEMLAKACVIKRSIELGYNSWVVAGDIIPLTHFSEISDPACCFYVAKKFEMMFMKNCKSSVNNWKNDFLSKVVQAAESLMDKPLPQDNKHFVYFAREVLETAGIPEMCIFEESKIGAKLSAEVVNKTFPNSAKMILLPRNMDLDSTERELSSIDMWLIDGDLSCVSVVCHQQ
ncbi:hypothetical protein AXF42_Ash004642 [Apostasia shenzhenica]|uniref:Uncharacterized protein n=1 Tax=Apostasia shenzhenica TaxID=1088818 RepID=A0A2I0BH89_9ASPA|nr:hypothetical protein AXF42_Ash004642 [Apostasia shenzhenica]